MHMLPWSPIRPWPFAEPTAPVDSEDDEDDDVEDDDEDELATPLVTPPPPPPATDALELETPEILS